MVLVEDQAQEGFVRRYLLRCGHNDNSIRVEKAPKARGAGEHWVRERYCIEVAHYRNRRQHRSAALVVVIDADTRTVAERERELSEALSQSDEAGRQQADAVALLIPKRHIETWILCLCGQSVSEEFDYKRSHDPQHDVTGKIKAASETFFYWSRENLSPPGHCPDSLRRGLREIRRIP